MSLKDAAGLFVERLPNGEKSRSLIRTATHPLYFVEIEALNPPMRSVTIAVDADNQGQWAFHCHNLYHMAVGMMATFAYSA